MAVDMMMMMTRTWVGQVQVHFWDKWCTIHGCRTTTLFQRSAVDARSWIYLAGLYRLPTNLFLLSQMKLPKRWLPGTPGLSVVCASIQRETLSTQLMRLSMIRRTWRRRKGLMTVSLPRTRDGRRTTEGDITDWVHAHAVSSRSLLLAYVVIRYDLILCAQIKLSSHSIYISTLNILTSLNINVYSYNIKHLWHLIK